MQRYFNTEGQCQPDIHEIYSSNDERFLEAYILRKHKRKTQGKILIFDSRYIRIMREAKI